MQNRLERISVTPTVGRQSQKQEFGETLKNTLASAGSVISGALVGSLPGAPMLSAAVASVTSFASGNGAARAATAATSVSSAATGVIGVGGALPSTVLGSSLDTPTVPSNLAEMMHTMRQEADRSTLMQMQMQQESRDYNTLSNVLKVRHDSAKAAINNIR